MGASMMSETFRYGGQAVLEGVMMRGRYHVVTTVRRPDGDLVVSSGPLAGFFTGRIRKVPLVRGVVVLVEAMVLGMKSLLFSASVALEEEGEKVSSAYLWGMVALALVFSVALFFLAPLFLTKAVGPSDSPVLFNLVEGLIRVAFFVGYLKLISMMPDLKRVFAYHGAEHKTINAYEDGVPLEVAEARKYPKVHTRCGTSFLFVVIVIAVAVFALVGLPSIWLMVLSRVVLVPVIAAISYEITYFGARHHDNVLVRSVLAPGLWLQSLTTREPDDRQLEVAIASLKKLIEIEEAA